MYAKRETAGERRAYEVACLEEVKRQIAQSTALERDRTVVHEVSLRGEYPNTDLILDVESQNPHRLKRETWQLGIWPEGPDPCFGSRLDDGSPPPTAEVGRVVMVQLYEF